MMPRLRHALTLCLLTFALVAGLAGAALLAPHLPSAGTGADLRLAAYLPGGPDSLCSEGDDPAPDHRPCPACRLLSVAVLPAPPTAGQPAFGRVLPGPGALPALPAAAEARDPVRSVRAPPAG